VKNPPASGTTWKRPSPLRSARYGWKNFFFESSLNVPGASFSHVTLGVVPAATRSQLQAWLFRIARNLVIDYHRKRRRTQELMVGAERPAREASQDVAVEVNEALARLADLDRDVFLMREVAGLGYDEIASACDLTVPAVRSRLHRTRLELRDWLSAPIAPMRTLPMRQADRRGQGKDR